MHLDCYVDYLTATIIDAVDPETGLTFYAGETFQQIKKRWPNAALTTLDDFCAWKANVQRSPVAWFEVNEREYIDMLSVLPPADRDQNGFLVGEPSDHYADTGEPRFQAYRKTADGRFMRSNRCLSRAEFRINPFQIQDHKRGK